MARRNSRGGPNVPTANEVAPQSINDVPTQMAHDDIRMIIEENEKLKVEKKLAHLKSLECCSRPQLYTRR